jgi:hypothetical protein
MLARMSLTPSVMTVSRGTGGDIPLLTFPSCFSHPACEEDEAIQ